MSYKFHPKDEVIILIVKIKGKKVIRARMVLDTGATYVMISWKMASALGLRPEISKARVKITTASGIEMVPQIVLSSVSVLKKRVKNVAAVVHDLPPGSGVDGLLGISYLKNFEVNINFKKGYLEIK